MQLLDQTLIFGLVEIEKGKKNLSKHFAKSHQISFSEIDLAPILPYELQPHFRVMISLILFD